MEARTLHFIADAVKGELRGVSGDSVARGVSLDSRTVAKDALFFAIAGERFDAHDFLPQVFGAGAAAAVVSRTRTDLAGGPVVRVDDTRVALGQLAARYRHGFSALRIAVAGSNGKTTTKNLIAAVLQQKYPTLASEGSFNNDIGVPITLLKLESSHRAAVFEAGTNHPGELRPLLRMIAPQFGVLTGIGPEHLEFFKDLDGVAQEEGAIAEELPRDGMLFVNVESEEARSIAARSNAPARTIGFAPDAQWRITQHHFAPDGMEFWVEGENRDVAGSYRTCLIGMHQVLNATMAIAVGSELGLGRAEIQRGLVDCQPARNRLQIRKAGSLTILDDTYNANEQSMKAALDTLAHYPQAGTRLAILGSMGELGEAAEQAHRNVGAHAAKLGIQQLLAIGPHRNALASGARDGALAVHEFESTEALLRELKSFIEPGSLVLVKASRSGRLERVVEALTSAFEEERSTA